MPPFPAFVGPAYSGNALLADCERTVGFYLEKNDGPGAVFPWSMLSFPGLTSRAMAGETPGRGIWASDGRCLRASGQKLYEVLATWVQNEIGVIGRDAHPVQFASSSDAGDEVAIASAGLIYIFTLSSSALSAAVGGLVAHQVAFMSGRILGLDRDTSTLRISNVNDGLTWDPTLETQRQAGDPWSALWQCGAYIYLFGPDTFDVYYDGSDAGAFPYPFIPVAGGTNIPMGIAAAWSVATVAGVPVWLAQSVAGGRTVVRGNGTSMPTRISNHPLERALKRYTTVSDAIGATFEYEGHAFYKLTFPTAGATWVFDATSGQWTEWPSWNSVTGREGAHRTLFQATFNGYLIADDRETGDLYTLDSDVYTDNGATKRWLRRCPFPKFTPESPWIFGDEFEVFMDVGVGLQEGQGVDPSVMIQISRNNGKVFGAERVISAGPVGTDPRVYFARYGRWRDGFGAVQLSMTDPVRWAISGAAMGVSQGTH